MFKKVFFILILPCVVLVTTSSGGGTPPWKKENVSFPMMNQEIRHSMQENDRQKTMFNKQSVNNSLETVNKNQWWKFKETQKTIQNRLRFVDFALQAIPTGYAITIEAQKIAKIQNDIYALIATAPYAVATILPGQLMFVYDMQMIVRFIIGIVASYGAMNQMEKAERKILLDFALDEVKLLRKDALAMFMRVRQLLEKIRFNKFMILNWVYKDQKIVKDIMGNFRNF